MGKSDSGHKVKNSANMSSIYTSGIVIWLYGSPEIHEKQFNTDLTAEELCLIAAKHCEITPISLPLFGLVRLDHVTWLTPQDTVKCSDSEASQFYFRVRTKPHLQKLKFIAENDKEAFHYLFHQLEQDFIEERLSSIYDAKITTDLALGFSVIDMVRIAKEKEIDIDRLLSQHNHKQFLPKKAIEAFRWPWRHLKLKLNFRSELQSMFEEKQSLKAIDLMLQYVTGMYNCVPNYATEQFCIVVDGQTSDKVVVDPFHTTMPGLYYKDKNEHICSLDNIMDLCLSESEFKKWNVQINRRDGMPIILSFPEKVSARSFIALVDAYYRMSVHYYQHLSNEVGTKFVADLKEMKCHGPEELNWVNERLQKSSKPGAYLLKMKRKEYDSYWLFTINRRPFVIKRLKENGKFVLYLSDSEVFPEEGCQSVVDLLRKIKQEEPRGVKLKMPIQPMDEGLVDSDLLLCKHRALIPTEDEEEGLPRIQTKSVVVIRSEDLQHREKLVDGRFKVVSRASWLGSANRNERVAIKQLNSKYKLDFAEEFQSIIDMVAFWNSPYIVQTHGVCLRGSLGMVTELLSYGSLEELLRANRAFKLFHAVSAAENVSQALMYLGENHYVHGSIRCSNILVKEYDSDTIVVKLSEPCMVGTSERIDKKLINEINAERFPWIDPLTYDTLVQTSPSSDMFSFGVALWEMLSGGAYPLAELRRDVEKIKSFYLEKKKLNTPVILNQSETDSDTLAGNKRSLGTLIGRCMDLDSNRISSRDLLRDIRQILMTIDPKSYDTVTYDGEDVRFANINFDPRQQPVGVQEDETVQVRPIHSTTAPGSTANARPLPAPPTDGFVIPPSCLKILSNEDLGSGFYGFVKKGLWTDKGVTKDCAVKFLKDQHMEKYYGELRKEIKMMTGLKHRNITKIYGECPFESMKLGLVMEFVARGSLRNYLLQKKEAVKRKLLDWSLEIAEGMKYLTEVQKPAIIHRDLAARNVLLTKDETVKISDFGLAKALKDKEYYRTTEDKMPVLWCPPEALSGCRFSTKSDIWSYGVTLWEIYSYGEKPNKGKLSPATSEDCDNKSSQDIFCLMIFNGSRLVKPDNQECTDGIYNVMRLCWDADAEQRPTFSEVIDKLDQVKLDKDYPM